MTDTDNLPRLSRTQFWTCFAILLAIFLFGAGPVWQRAFNIDLSVYYSYIPIPALVLACLLWSRKLTLRGFLLDTLELTLVKFGITASMAIVLWSVAAPSPPRLAAQRTPWMAPALPSPPPDPTRIPPGKIGGLSGIVVDAEGNPASHAFVFIAAGLEGYVFAAPTRSVRLVNDGSGIAPRFAIAQTYQPIEARSADGRLHNILAMAEGEAAIFNVPLLPSGASNVVVVREPHPRATLKCTVHQHSPEEAPAELIVLSHPFFTTTGQDGRFRFEGVPAGSLKVTAVVDPRHEAFAEVLLRGEDEAYVRVALRQSQ